MSPSLTSALPIDAVRDEVLDALARGRNLVLIAPPGAGKTTHLPLALLDTPWLAGRTILLVQPRRLAALGAARRMADTLGEPVGGSVGHRVRFDTKTGPTTRLVCVTDGVFNRMIAQDPELTGVGLVLFDEVHERALAADLGLAFALEAQTALREDLRLVAMSATVDGAAFATLLSAHAPCATITSEGRLFPVETRYAPEHLSGDVRAPQAVAAASLEALRLHEGDGLAFLPGQREIETAIGALRGALGEAVAVHALYGAASRTAQQAALAPDPQGRRKLVVASAIAETSLTIPGVRFVIDAGLARRPIYDPVRGLTRLETRPASRASIDQRRGRAGRTAPGHCVRLWRAAEEGGRPAQDRPEILDADLAKTRLDMAVWGCRARDGLPLLTPPPERAWAEAGRLLADLGALDDQGGPTEQGRRMAQQPVHPRLAAMLDAAEPDARGDAAWAAVLAEELSERGPVDAMARLAEALTDRSRAKRLRDLHRRIAGTKDGAAPRDGASLARHLLRAFPDRVAKRQKDDGQTAIYKLAQGMQARLATHEPLASEPLLVVLDLGGGRGAGGRGGGGAHGGGARLPDIRLALALDAAVLTAVLGDRLVETEEARFDTEDWSEKVRAQTRLGALVLAETPRPRRAGIEALDAIGDYIRQRGFAALHAGDDQHKGKSDALIGRYEAFLASDGRAPLMERIDMWLPALVGAQAAPPFAPSTLDAAFRQALDWQEAEAFDRQWPSSIDLGEGRRAAIHYDHPAGPAIRVRPAWLYGRDAHPTIGSGSGSDFTPLLIEFLSPADRPIALTADLPAFWRGGWSDVRKDMRARYPKHRWPEEPWKDSPGKAEPAAPRRGGPR